MSVPILTGPPPRPSVPVLQAVGTGAPPPPRAGRRRGREIRIGQVRHFFDFLPPWTLRDAFGVTAHCCGKCFEALGDDPFRGRPGTMRPGAPGAAACVFCGRRCVPCD